MIFSVFTRYSCPFTTEPLDGISNEFVIYKGYKIDDTKIKAPRNSLTRDTAFVAAALTLGTLGTASAGHHVNSGGTRPHSGFNFLAVDRKTFLPK